ncbi:Gldg family protein, partial [Pseudomonas aeruginosa]
RRHTLAARIQGPAKSAFAEGFEGHREGLKEARNINVIVVADTDLLSDRMWVQVQDFFGQRAVVGPGLRHALSEEVLHLDPHSIAEQGGIGHDDDIDIARL